MLYEYGDFQLTMPVEAPVMRITPLLSIESNVFIRKAASLMALTTATKTATLMAPRVLKKPPLWEASAQEDFFIVCIYSYYVWF